MQCSAESLHRNKRITDSIKKRREARLKAKDLKSSRFPFFGTKPVKFSLGCLYLARAGSENGRVRKPQTCSQPEQEMKEIGSHRKYAAAGRRERTFAEGRERAGAEKFRVEREVAPPFAR